MRTLAVLAVLAFAGCTIPKATHGSAYMVHELDDGPLDAPVQVPSFALNMAVRLALEPLEFNSGCAWIEPVRIALLDPAGNETMALALPEERCDAHLQTLLDAKQGTWTARFEGRGDVRASVEVEFAGERSPGRALVGT